MKPLKKAASCHIRENPSLRLQWLNHFPVWPGVFSYICPMSCGIQESETLDASLQGIKKAGYKLYWIGCGTADFAWPGTEVLDKALTRNGMEHTLYASDGGHVWANWRLYLNTFAQLLFK